MLALIAGTGDLPPALVARLPVRPLICALDGFRPQITPDVTFRIEHLGSLLELLHSRSVTEVCLAGAVKRPAIDPQAIDAATAPLLPRIGRALAAGDDGALRAIIAVFEDAGFAIRAAHDLAPDLLPPPGVPTRLQVSPQARSDAVLGEETLARMGAADSGQACILRQGRVLATEDAAGTDAMIQRLAPTGAGWDPIDLAGDLLGGMAEWLSGPEGSPRDGRGALLFKGPKPQQDRRADLPVIGIGTVRHAAAAGLAGIVIEAGGVMVLDLPAVVEELDDAGLFLWIRPKGGA